MILRVQQFVFVFIFCVFGNISNCKATPTIDVVRELFFHASYDFDAFLSLKTVLENEAFVETAQEEAYRAAFNVLSARYAEGTIEKIQLIYTGLAKLDSIIELNNEELEFRFLRFSLEYHIPSYLFVKKHIKLDCEFILRNISNVKHMTFTQEFKEDLLKFIEESKCFTADEIKILRQGFFQ